MARERNNIYAIAADAVDLALDTAGTIGSMVGGIVGVGNNKTEESERDEVSDAEQRVASSLRQEAEAVKPRTHKARASSTRARKTPAKRVTKRVTKTARKTASRKSAR